MFTATSREQVRDWLTDLAREDERVTAAALLGSGADSATDRWSDIDLALRLVPGADVAQVADSWTDLIGARLDPVARTDLWRHGGLYRVFLLPDTLQLDLSFWPDDKFGAYGPSFRLVFGEANDVAWPPRSEPNSVLALGWLHALHARSSIARGRGWQAVYMIDGVRDHAVQLVCLRHDVPVHEGRGVDRLPAAITAGLVPTLPHGVDRAELTRAFAAAAELLAAEAAYVDPDNAVRIRQTLVELVRTCDPAADGIRNE